MVKQKSILFVGDPHGEHQHICQAIKQCKPVSTVLVGDMCYEQPIDHIFNACMQQHQLHWIHGNHDTDTQAWYDSIFMSAWAEQNMHGKVVQVAGLNIAGLGGVFRKKIWGGQAMAKYPSRESWQAMHKHKRFAPVYAASKRKHESSIWLEDYERLAEESADILVLHEAPTSDRYGHQALDDLATRLGVRLIIHGHHHRFYCDTLNNGIAVVGLGLAQLATLDTDAFHQSASNQAIFKAFQFEHTIDKEGYAKYTQH